MENILRWAVLDFQALKSLWMKGKKKATDSKNPTDSTDRKKSY